MKNPSNPQDLEALFESYVRGDLSPADWQSLEKQLLDDPLARKNFRRFLRLDANLTQRAGDAMEEDASDLWKSASHGATRGWHALSTEPAPPLAKTFRSPIWAAAAGLMIGLLGASAVWAYAAPTVVGAMETVLKLFSEDFEGPGTHWKPGFPQEWGALSGDTASIVGAQPSALPFSGKQMLRLIRSDYPGEPAARSRSANQMAALDLSRHQDWIAAGQGRIEAQAAFWVSGLEGTQSFAAGLDVLCFAEDPRERSATSWSSLRKEHLGMSAKRKPIKTDTARWEVVQSAIDVPPETRFVVLHLVVSNDGTDHAVGGIEFPAAYVDDISLQLRRVRKGGFKISR
ncbi:MAG: hypothetical protein RLZZ399_1511 [Verrucomicrobiota bacterium]|jgi:hypothetical protein